MGFDATLIWLLVVGAGMLLTGLFVGYTLRGRDAQAREAQLQSEIGSVRDSFDEHKRRVTKHFERSSDLFRDLTRHYAALYTHLSQGARDFCKGSSPSLGVELRMLLSDGEVGADAEAYAANDYRVGGHLPAAAPGAPPPPRHARHTLEASCVDARAPVVGEVAESVVAAVVAPEVAPTARSKPSPKPGEGIGEWLARLDARVRDHEPEGQFSSGYERSARTEPADPARASGSEAHQDIVTGSHSRDAHAAA